MSAEPLWEDGGEYGEDWPDDPDDPDGLGMMGGHQPQHLQQVSSLNFLSKAVRDFGHGQKLAIKYQLWHEATFLDFPGG